MKRIAVACVLIIAILSGCSTTATTKTTYNFDLTDFHALADGTTYEDVVTIIGGEGKVWGSKDRSDPKYIIEHYQWDSSSGGYMVLTFINGKLNQRVERDLSE